MHDDKGSPPPDFDMLEVTLDDATLSQAEREVSVEGLIAEREQMVRQADNMRDAWNLERQRNHELASQVTMLRHELNLQRHRERAQGVPELTARITSLEKQVELFQSEAGRMQREVALAQTDTERMRQRLELAMRGQSQRARAGDEPMVAELEAELAMGRQMVETLSAACERYEKQIGKLRADNATLRRQRDHLQRVHSKKSTN